MRSDYLCCQNPTPPNTWLTTYATAGKISTEADSVMKRILLFTTIFLALLINRSTAQELNCQVSVLTPQIQQTDKTLFETMQKAPEAGIFIANLQKAEELKVVQAGEEHGVGTQRLCDGDAEEAEMATVEPPTLLLLILLILPFRAYHGATSDRT